MTAGVRSDETGGKSQESGGHQMIKHFRELIVCQKAFEQAMKIFGLTKHFPNEEKYYLTDQIRRSSRSVCANLAEAWHKRRYSAHFVSKLTDSDAEAAETQVWLDFSLECEYLNRDDYKQLVKEYEEIGRMVDAMISSPDKFCSGTKM